MPAKAGTHATIHLRSPSAGIHLLLFSVRHCRVHHRPVSWIPASAGMTFDEPQGGDGLRRAPRTSSPAGAAPSARPSKVGDPRNHPLALAIRSIRRRLFRWSMRHLSDHHRQVSWIPAGVYPGLDPGGNDEVRERRCTASRPRCSGGTPSALRHRRRPTQPTRFAGLSRTGEGHSASTAPTTVITSSGDRPP